MASFTVPILLFAALAPSPSARTPAARLAVECAVQPLSVRERVAQTIMMGIPGQRLGQGAADLIAAYAGAVILQGHNVRDTTQLAALTRALHRKGPRRLLIAVDEEGGRVARLGAKGVATELPSAREAASSMSADEVRGLASTLGAELTELGIDWDLAPVLDVTDARADTVIGDRAFGSDPDVVAEYGLAFAEGLAGQGVLTTGKHFPGHGATAVDSHRKLPVVDSPTESLAVHVAPYLEVHPQLDAVMTANVKFTTLDPRYPASLSPATIRLLRDDVGFDGVVMTDALEMDAISERWTIPEAAELALRAGADMVLVGPWGEVESTSDRLVRAVRRGTLPAARLDEAVGRVLALKGYPSAEIGCLLA
jgi:beta-N-acetylhexosaminidase